MSTTRHPRLTRPGRNATARQDAADGTLSRLIANAAPPRDYRRELRGETEAVAAFNQARLSPASQPRSRTMSAGKLVAVKTAAAIIVLSGGGVALAAANGDLPAQLGGHPASSSSSAASASTTSASASAAGTRGVNHPAASPTPALRGLCHAYTAGAGNNPGKALHNPAFSALISAAGGRDRVTSYCASVLAAPPGHSAGRGADNGKGNQSGHATGKPAAHPTPASPSHPANSSGGGNSNSGGSGNSGHSPAKPTTAPTAQPAAHPTGKPSPHP